MADPAVAANGGGGDEGVEQAAQAEGVESKEASATAGPVVTALPSPEEASAEVRDKLEAEVRE